MISKKVRILCVGAAGVAVAAALSVASCAQTPPNVITRTFQQPQKVDFVCLEVDNPKNIQPKPQNECSAVPAGVAANPVNGVGGALVSNHVFAVVTQTTPGTLGVVDLTAGTVIDEDRSTPGTNFIPVGANPTDVAVTPDGMYTYVSSADPNKPAIYQIDNRLLLGDSTGAPGSKPLRLTDLPTCALPQAPQGVAVVAVNGQDDAGATIGPYAPVVLLRAGTGGSSAAVATIDPNSMNAGIGTPGSAHPCSVLGVTALSNNVPTASAPGPAWSDGVPYADAGDLRLQEPAPGPQCVWPSPDGGTPNGGIADAEVVEGALADGASSDAAAALPNPAAHPTSMVLRSDIPILYVADEAVSLIHVIDLGDPTNPRELEPLLATSVADPLRRVSVGGIAVSPPTHDYNTYLYAIDSMQGTLMVYDVTDPATSPHVPLRRPHAELNPLVPVDRLGFSAPVAAVAFVQHDWPIASQTEPSPPIHQYSGLLCNPNPNALPEAGTVLDRGAYYRADYAALVQSNLTAGGTVQGFPSRLRGIFGFVTLSNGALVTIDVDDWDAPCRRPDPMASGWITGALDLPQPEGGPDDLDPYHAPYTYMDGSTGAVTLETFFPVSAPHRLRSAFLMRSDPAGGQHMPNVVSPPQLFNANGAPVTTTGSAGVQSPLILPTPLTPGFFYPPYLQNPTEPNPARRTFSPLLPDGGPVLPLPSDVTRGAPGIRLSFDDPTAHQDQNWSVTYEGALPTFGTGPSAIAATIASNDGYQTLILSAPGARMCARGVEDWDIGQARAGQFLATLNALGLAPLDDAAAPRLPALPPAQMGDAGSAPPPQPTLPQWTADYVEIADDLLPSSDKYWTEQSTDAGGFNDCWEPPLDDDSDPNIAMNRYNACYQRFGPANMADQNLWRDLPIIHAKDDSLMVGRFAWYDKATDASGNAIDVPQQTTNRVVVGADPSNAPFLKIMRCCFHHQASFRVRAGGEWLAVGSAVGLLHHVKADATGACVLSCDPHAALTNARSFDVPWWVDNTCTPAQLPFDPNNPPFDRNSPLAMRNPSLSYVVWSGCGPPNGYGDHTLSQRDLNWRFSTTGSFAAQSTALTNATTGNATSPQAMRFISSLGQLAIVDGEAQGLVLVDLNLVAAVRNFF
jgi:hypothetical protein